MLGHSYRTFNHALGFLVAISLAFASSTVTAQDETDIESQFQEGVALVQQDKMDEAVEIFRSITESNEDLGPAWFYLGYTLHMSGKLDKAIKVHQKAAEFDEFTGIANYNLGCAYALTGKQDDAIAALETAVENGFDDIDQFEMDEDLHSLHTDVRFAKIMAELDGAEELATKLDEAESYLGNGDFAKAAEVYTAILDEDSNNPFVTYRLGYSLHGSGDLEAALKMHTKATRFDSVAPIATYNIACVHSLNENADKAFEALNKSLDLGFVRLDALSGDPDLQNIRDDERFEKVVARAKELQKGSDKKKKKASKGEDF